jgi:hypothetical protein
MQTAGSSRLTASLARADGTTLPILLMQDLGDSPLQFTFDSITSNPGPGEQSAGAYSGMLELKPGDVLRWQCELLATPPGPGFALFPQTSCELRGESVGTTLACGTAQ